MIQYTKLNFYVCNWIQTHRNLKSKFDDEDDPRSYLPDTELTMKHTKKDNLLFKYVINTK